MGIIVSKKGSHSAQIVNKSDFALERNLQDYICDHPEAIPVGDKRLLVAARELETGAGPIDAFAVVEGPLYKRCSNATIGVPSAALGAGSSTRPRKSSAVSLRM